MQAGKGHAGYTLVELVMALGIAILVAGWALPSLRDWWLGQRVIAASNQFVGMIEVTRYQSLGAPRPITICGTPDGLRCDRDQGRRLVVFQDRNANGRVEAGEPLLSSEPFLDSDDFWLVWRSFQNKDYLRWAAGRTDSMNGTFTLCNRQRNERWLRQMVLNRAGRTRTVVPVRVGGSTLQAARKACGW